MNQEDLKKAVELLEQSSSFGILLPEQPDFDTLAAAEAIVQIIVRLPEAASAEQKTAGLLSPAALPADTDTNIFPKLTGPTPLLKEFIISVNTSRAPVSQLRYEKPENRIDIILTPKLASLGLEQVSFHEGTIKCDCLIAIGVPDIERLSNIADFPPEFFTENKLINIDIGEKNTQFGEANLVDQGRASRSELVWQLFTCLQADTTNMPSFSLPPDIGTLLLAGIFSATRELTGPHVTADTFAAVAELVRSGAGHTDAQKLSSADRQNMPLPLAQLCARATVRSKHDIENDILWSFLTAEDFTKTDRTPDDIPAVLNSIRVTLPKRTTTALLWQQPQRTPPEELKNEQRDSIRVFIAGNQRMLDAISSKEETEPDDRNQGIVLRAAFPSFRDAEDHAHSLIRAAL